MEYDLRTDNSVNAGRKVPALPFTGQSAMEAATVHVAAGRQGVLGWVWVLSPSADLELRIACQLEFDRIAQTILRRLGQVEDEFTLGIRGGVVNRRNLPLTVNILQEDLYTRHGLVSIVLFIWVSITIQVDSALVALLLTPSTICSDSRSFRGALSIHSAIPSWCCVLCKSSHCTIRAYDWVNEGGNHRDGERGGCNRRTPTTS